MQTLKIKSTTTVEIEFELPKYFRIAHHHYMIIDNANYLFVKSSFDEYFYPEISMGRIESMAPRWYDCSIKQELHPLTEEEFKAEYIKANVILVDFLN